MPDLLLELLSEEIPARMQARAADCRLGDTGRHHTLPWRGRVAPKARGGVSAEGLLGGGAVMGLTRISAFRFEKARQLRRRETHAERLLWKALKHMPVEGSHFRRQVPIGRYVVDFACLAARLVIEVDGARHGAAANSRRDQVRTAWLESQGYRVLRFWNTEVVRDVNGVMTVIHAAVYGCDGVPAPLRHKRARRALPATPLTPPRRAKRADPPPPGEGLDAPTASPRQRPKA